MSIDHRVLAGRFNARLGRPMAVRLVGGAEEPLYLPPRGPRGAIIRYARDHAQSVLHELAHWCLAGAERRRLVDYGYWYEPPPRCAVRQARFFRAEAPVQALEMLFARACGLTFHFSTDDPEARRNAAQERFEADVTARYRALRRDGPSGDALAVLRALTADGS
jgi:elongation factor P hydroxylase